MKEQVLQGEQMLLNAPCDRLFIPPTSVHFQYCLHTSIIAVHRQWCFEMLVCFVFFFQNKKMLKGYLLL